jgi:biopolymer transport protein TolR
MAMTVGGKRRGVLAEINVTPLIDVMLVLLIIFMVVTPALDRPEGLRLPSTSNSPDRKNDKRVVVVVRGDATAWIGRERMDSLGDLLVQVKGRLQDRSDAVVSVEADERLPYARVQEVMDVCRDAGAEQLVLRTERRLEG